MSSPLFDLAGPFVTGALSLVTSWLMPRYMTFARNHFVAARGADTAKMDEAIERLHRPMRWLRHIGMSSIAIGAIALLAHYM